MSPQMKSLQDVRHLADAELSLRARLGYVALLLVSAGMASVIVSLWVTETLLPVRTQLAFGAMTAIAGAWMVFSTWVLRARRPLYARDRLIAGRMAVAFTAVFVAGASAAVFLANHPASHAALATGVVMLALAIRAMAAARRQFLALSRRRDELAA